MGQYQKLIPFGYLFSKFSKKKKIDKADGEENIKLLRNEFGTRECLIRRSLPITNLIFQYLIFLIKKEVEVIT